MEEKIMATRLPFDEYRDIDEVYNRMMNKVSTCLDTIVSIKSLIDEIVRETFEDTGYNFKSEVKDIMKESISDK